MYWNLSSKPSSLSNFSSARRLSMFMISFFANLFCRMFNPFKSLPTYFLNTTFSLTSFSSYINNLVNFWRYSVFVEGINFLLLIRSFIFHPFWLPKGLISQWQLLSYDNVCYFRFKWYQKWAIVFNKRTPVLNIHIVKDVTVSIIQYGAIGIFCLLGHILVWGYWNIFG